MGLLRGVDHVVDRAEAVTAGIEQAAKIARAAVAAAAGSALRIAARAGGNRGPVGAAQLWRADFARVGPVDLVGSDVNAADHAIAAAAGAILAALPVWATLAVAAFAVVVGAAHLAVAHGSPVVPITAGIARLAGVARIDIAIIDAQGSDTAAWFATVHRAALVGGTAFAITTLAAIFARGPVPPVRPVVRILEIVALLAVVPGIGVSVPDRFAIDDAGARAADTGGAAASSSVITGGAVVRRRPGAERELWFADLAVLARFCVAGRNVLTVDMAMRAAFLAGDAVAAFAGRAAFAIAADPAGYTATGRLVYEGRPASSALGGIAYQATLRRSEDPVLDELAVDLAAAWRAGFVQAATMRGKAAFAIAADLAAVATERAGIW